MELGVGRMNKRIIRSLLMIIMTCLFIIGCQREEPIEVNDTKVLRVLGDTNIIRQSLNYFLVQESNIDVEIIDIQQIYQEALSNANGESFNMEDVIKDILVGVNPPDVIYLSQTQLYSFIDEDLLISLDDFIHQTNFDIENMDRTVVTAIRNAGNGTIYALTPSFDRYVLYYNKDLFDKMGVPYPEDRMTWEEIFNLARQLSHVEDGVQYYGFAFYGAYPPYIILKDHYLDPSLDYSMFDEEFTQFIVHTPERVKAWEDFIALYHEGTIAPPYDYEKNKDASTSTQFFEVDLFMGGRAAMTVGGYEQIRFLAEMENGFGYFSSNFEHPEPFDWDIVTYPVHLGSRNYGSEIWLTNLMGINAKSESPELAWKYISFMNGEKAAKAIANYNVLLSRMEYVDQPIDKDFNFQAFTLLDPLPDDTEILENLKLKKAFPDQEWWIFENLEMQYFERAFNGEMSVEEALAELEKKRTRVLG